MNIQTTHHTSSKHFIMDTIRALLLLTLSLSISHAWANDDTFIGLPPAGELRDFLKQSNQTDTENRHTRNTENPGTITQPKDTNPSVKADRKKTSQPSRSNPASRQSRPKSIYSDTLNKIHEPRILRVGRGQQYLTPSMAAADAHDGDIIEIDANSNYEGDEAIWRANNLHIRGVGGRPHIFSRNTIKNGKALWVIRGNNIVVDNIEFSGAKVPSMNGAGIRQEGRNLVIRNCYFHHNQMGILVNNDQTIETLIEYSEFNNNSLGGTRPVNGRIGHNIYIGRTKMFTLRFSYIHHGRIGHNVKSRSRLSKILYNRIMDEQEGRASYQIDFPNGGVAYVIGNAIQQGTLADNWAMIAFGLEKSIYKNNTLILANNTLVNDRNSGQFINSNENATIKLFNNIFAGNGKKPAYHLLHEFNLLKKHPRFVSREQYDYRLKADSEAIDKGVIPKDYLGMSLLPEFEYLHKSGGKTRPKAGVLDYGAFEFIE